MTQKILIAVFLMVLSDCLCADEARDWSLADGSTESGTLESVEIVIHLPSGEAKNVPINSLSKEDQKFVGQWLLKGGAQFRTWTSSGDKFKVDAKFVRSSDDSITIQPRDGRQLTIALDKLSDADRQYVQEQNDKTEKTAKAKVVGQNKPAINQRIKVPANGIPNRTGKVGRAAQNFTAFGDLKLTLPEILRFLDDCKTDKPKLLDTLRIQLNAKASTNGVSAEEIQAAKATYQFVSKDDVLIVLRDRWRNDGDKIFKFDVSGYPSETFGVIEVLKIVDKRTAYVSMNGLKAFVEGVDTSKMPLGKWNSYYMFKKTGTRKVPAQIGEDEVHVYQAISDEGFPKDVILW